MSDEQQVTLPASVVDLAAWICECYAGFIRENVMSADIERHPYVPQIEGCAEELREAIAHQFATPAPGAPGQEAAAVQAVGAVPLFWYRPCGGNLYEGPFHTNSSEGKLLREEKPDAWHPLYTHTPPAASFVASDEQIITAASHRGMWGLRDDAGNLTTDGRRLIGVVRALSGSLGDGGGTDE